MKKEERFALKFFLQISVAVIALVSASLSHLWDKKENVLKPQSDSLPASLHKTGSESFQDVLVVKVIDGDTFELENGERVRLIGVDTPESRKNAKAKRDSQRSQESLEEILRMGQLAKEALTKIVFHKRVRLEFDVGQRDKYGRLLAYVYLKNEAKEGPTLFPYYYQPDHNEIFVNATLVQLGYASPMTIPPNVKFADLFQVLSREAQDKKRGLWQDKKVAYTKAD